jgi:hypothetical protein
MESSKIGIVTPHHCGDHVKDGADVAPSATHHTFALITGASRRVWGPLSRTPHSDILHYNSPPLSRYKGSWQHFNN